ncbi:MAG: FAD-dependent oxidoreductase, partial [Fidelibacterota bacterium]
MGAVVNPRLGIGVFACDCGGEIPAVVDLDLLLQKVASLGEVSHVERLPYGCSAGGEATMAKRIREKPLGRVVVLGCSPRIMESRFQRVCSNSGLNPFLLEMVNIRDHCVRVHKADPAAASDKAWDLTRLGIARARRLAPVEPVKTAVHPRVMVVGGGVAGLTAALSLGRQDVGVILVEKESRLGGALRNDGHRIPGGFPEAGVISDLVDRVRRSDNIDVFTGSEVVTVSGSYGQFRITIRTGSRTQTVRCGAAILATGAEECKPVGHYGYGEDPGVMTQMELARVLTEKRPVDGVEKVVMIQCVGARTPERPYCGRVCCLWAVDNAVRLKELKPSLGVTLLYRDIPKNPGPDARTLERARDLGIAFLRFGREAPPDTDGPSVTVKTVEGKAFELPYDWLVLSTPLISRESSRFLARSFRVPVDRYGFIPETLPGLKAHQFSQPCIHAVGSAHLPCTPSEAMGQAYGRSARIASLIRAGEISSQRLTVTVAAEMCRGCATCLEWCPFDVPVIESTNGESPISFIDPLLCRGCGSCVVHCPTGAASLTNLEDETLFDMMESVLSGDNGRGVKAVAFLCEWSGYAAADLAGVRGKELPGGILPIRIPCAGRISPGLI